MENTSQDVRFKYYRRLPMKDRFGILKIPQSGNDIFLELSNFINNIFTNNDQQVCSSRIADLLYDHLLKNSNNLKLYNELLEMKNKIVKEHTLKMEKEIGNDELKLLEYWIRFKNIMKEISNIFSYVNMKTQNQFNIHSYKLDYQYFLELIVHKPDSVLCEKIVELVLNNYHGKYLNRLLSLIKLYTKYSFEGSIVRKYKDIFIEVFIEKIKKRVMLDGLIKLPPIVDQLYPSIINISDNIQKNIIQLDEYLDPTISKKIKLQLLGYFVNILLEIIHAVDDECKYNLIQGFINNDMKIIKIINYMILDENKKGTSCENFDMSILLNILTEHMRKQLDINITDKRVFSNEELYDRLYNIYDDYVNISQIFKNDLDKQYISVVDTYFSNLINNDDIMIKYICVSIHDNIKKLNNDDIDKFMSNMKIITYIKNKDTFLITYAKYLQDRLLNDIKQQIDHSLELKIIKMISTVFDISVVDMEQMIKEHEISRTHTNEFRKLVIQFNENSAFIDVEYDLDNVNITVISNNVWKLIDRKNMNNYTCIIPKQLMIYHVIYKNFFNKKYENNPEKILDWLHDTSTVILKVHFDKQSYVFKMTASQAFVLMLYDTEDSYTYEKLIEKLEMPKTILDGILKSFEIIGIVKKVNNTFNYNNYFYNKQKHIDLIKLLNIKQKETIVKDVIMFDRKDIIKANILRCVKISQKINSEDLFNQVKERTSSQFEIDNTLYDEMVDNLLIGEFIKKEGEEIVYC